MFFYFSVVEGTSPYNEPMFLVYYSPLVELFRRFCFNCKAESPKVQVKHIGSMATVVQACSKFLIWRTSHREVNLWLWEDMQLGIL